MINLGRVRPGTTIYIPWDTFSGSTGASITMSGLLVGDIQVYKDGGMTQRASTNGFTLLDTDGTDLDGITGIQGVSIDLADNSTAGFYSAGSRYFVVIASVTVDSQTVNFVAATFTIGFEGAFLDTTLASVSSQTSMVLTNGPAEANALVGCPVIFHDVASAVQQAYGIITAYAVTTKTITLLTAPTFTVAATDNVSVFLPANTHWIAAALPSVSTAHFGVNVVNAGGTAWGSGAITAGAIAADAITSAKLADNAITAAKINADAITSAKVADGTITAAKLANAAITAAKIDAAAITATQAPNLDAAITSRASAAALAAAQTDISAILVDTAEIGVAGAGLTDITLPATGLDNIGAASTYALAVADAIWDEVLTGATHNTPASAGRRLRDISTTIVITGTLVSATADGFELDNDAAASDDIYNQNYIAITNGLGAGQTRVIVDYASDRTGRIFRDWEVTPDNTSEYAVLAHKMPGVIATGLVVASTSTVTELDADSPTVLGAFVGSTIYIASGTGVGQVRVITAYSVDREATVSPAWTTTPDTTSIFVVYANGKALVDSISAAALATINTEVDTAFTTPMADSVSTDGSIATREQALYMALQALTEFAVSGTTMTIYKVDGTTPLFTCTLNDGTTPTAITRAT